jgi:apolipoprotein D and lipocalin family protein
MMHARVLGLGLMVGLLGGCASGLVSQGAPEPKAAVSASLLNGMWYEIARTPMSFTDGCVAGTTDFHRDGYGRLIESDACQTGSPEGPAKRIAGPVTILNPGQNTKYEVHYTLFGFVPLPRTWWILDHGPADQWFILANPGLTAMSIFTRDPRPSAAEVARLTEIAGGLGYDTHHLEYPQQFPPGKN